MAKIQKSSLDTAGPVATPDNTPVPGGGSWRWSDTAPHWVPNMPDQPLQLADPGALQTTEPNQE